jgi:hypothetical protein
MARNQADPIRWSARPRRLLLLLLLVSQLEVVQASPPELVVVVGVVVLDAVLDHIQTPVPDVDGEPDATLAMIVVALLENQAFIPGLIFHLYRVFFSPGTNKGIRTSWSHRPVQMSTHMGARGSPPHLIQMPHTLHRVVAPPGTNVLASYLYRAEPPPVINVVTFLPIKKETRYK